MVQHLRTPCWKQSETSKASTEEGVVQEVTKEDICEAEYRLTLPGDRQVHPQGGRLQELHQHIQSQGELN